jgi:hypothetical protein
LTPDPDFPAVQRGYVRVEIRGNAFVVADDVGRERTQHVIPMRAASDVALAVRRSRWRWVWWLVLVVALALLAVWVTLAALEQSLPTGAVPVGLLLLGGPAGTWGLIIGIAGALGLLLTPGVRRIAIRGLAGQVIWSARLANVKGAENTYRSLALGLLKHELGHVPDDAGGEEAP